MIDCVFAKGECNSFLEQETRQLNGTKFYKDRIMSEKSHRFPKVCTIDAVGIFAVQLDKELEALKYVLKLEYVMAFMNMSSTGMKRIQ